MARKFTFRLRPLLRIRQRAEEARKLALAKVVGRLNEQTERAHRYDGMIRDEHHRLCEGHLVGSLDVRHLAHHRRYVNSVMRAMVETLCERAGTQQQVARVRTDLIEAVKGRKVLENLRDRRRDEWARQIDREVTHEMDEIGGQVHRRQRLAEHER